MSGRPQIPWPAPDVIRDGLKAHPTREAYRLALQKQLGHPISRGAMDYKVRSLDDPQPVATERGVSLDVDPAEWGDIDSLLRSRGLDPDEWVVVRVRVNEWGDPEKPSAQLRVDLELRSMDALLPARADGWRPPPRLSIVPKDEAELVVFFGDQHAPHHDPDLHAAACEWLRKNKPSRGVLIGDLLDFDAVSRHRSNPEWATTMQDAVDTAYSLLRGYIHASPSTRWQLLSGNHEERLRNAILDHLRGVYGLSQAKAHGEERRDAVLSVKHLLRLDELGVEWVGSGGEYAHEQIKVSEHLAARHGWIARKGSGASAKATLDHLRYSCVIGHCHRQGIVFHTAHDIDGTPMQLIGVEAGTMARVAGGLGYAVAADWQAGFATARIWPDGTFSCDLAKWVDGSLLWANQRITPSPAALEVAA